MNLKCSIIIPVYNGERFLKETIENVLSSTYKNLEIVLIDDFSVDNSREILKEYSGNPKFKIILNEYNYGLNANIAKGIFYSTGEYIQLLGQDDLIESEKIEKQIKYLENTNLDAVYANTKIIDKDAKRLADKMDASEFITLLNNNKKKLLEIAYSASPGHYLPMSQTALFKTGVMKELLPFRTRNTLDDWPILVKMLEQYNIGFIDEELFYWRQHENNNSKNIYWNLGISVQSLLNTVPDKYKLITLSNNFLYTAQAFAGRREFEMALKFILLSIVSNFGRNNLTLLLKYFRKAICEKCMKKRQRNKNAV